MESIAKSRLFPLLGGQRLHRLQVEVVVQVEIVQILAMDQQIQHVVPLTTDLQHPEKLVLNISQLVKLCPYLWYANLSVHSHIATQSFRRKRLEIVNIEIERIVQTTKPKVLPLGSKYCRCG